MDIRIARLRLIALCLVLPLAQPFVSANTPTSSRFAGSATAALTNLGFVRKQQQQRTTKAKSSRSLHPRSRLAKESSNDHRIFHTVVDAHAGDDVVTVVNDVSVTDSQPSLANHSETRKSPKQPGVISRLLFNYASVLLQDAKHRSLDADDVYEFRKADNSTRMENSVESLTTIYNRLREDTRQQLSRIQKPSRRLAMESWLLAKALAIHQRRSLLTSGALRFLNTAIQALPPLLVSRLLRLVEAGGERPVSDALVSALALACVLTAKTITENQYFNLAIKVSSQMRGSLSGMIFDKALRLPEGGSGVTHQDDSKKGKNSEKVGIGAGGVLNLMSSDAGIVEWAAIQVHNTWDSLLQLTVYTTLLYTTLGPSVFNGIAVLLAAIPINSLALRLLNRMSRYENEARDRRTKRTTEAIANMKLLKLFSWEQSFADDVREHRQEELRRRFRRGLVRALSSSINNAVPAFVLVVTLKAYARTGAPLLASTIFTAISLFNQLRFPLFFLPMLIDSLANGRNAIKRIANFLSTEELLQYVDQQPPLVAVTDDGQVVQGGEISMTNGNFLWPSMSSGTPANETAVLGTESPALAGVNLKVEPGEVVAVVGSVGSGKSALIKGLLGELEPVSGEMMQAVIASSPFVDPTLATEWPKVVSHGKVAYCSQEAWLPKGTIREAIVFGREFDKDRYLSAIHDAGLDNDIYDDLDGRVDGTNTGKLSHNSDVGEHGASLSGGQRARVALARALYAGSDTKVFLLDDCLAALDAAVGNLVFERLTKRMRTQKAAVLMVSNDPSIPLRCDRTIVMGKVDASNSCSQLLQCGTNEELVTRGYDLRGVMSTNKEEKGFAWPGMNSTAPDVQEIHREQPLVSRAKKGPKKEVSVIDYSKEFSTFKHGEHADPEGLDVMECCPDAMDDPRLIAKVETPNNNEHAWVSHDSFAGSSRNSTSESAEDILPSRNASRGSTSTKPKQGTSADESMTRGAVPRDTYLSYFKAVKNWPLIAAALASYLTVNAAQFFQQYTVARWSDVAKGDAMAAVLGAQYMKSLTYAAGIVSVFLWLRSFLIMRVGIGAGRALYSRMLNSVFAAPLSFFDSTESGQLLSRFGKEMLTVDSNVPESIGSVLFCFLAIFTSIGALAGAVTPVMVLPFAGIGVLYLRYMTLYRKGARDMKRAETKSRSPVFTHFGEALRGAETIRSVDGSKRLWSRDHRALTDENVRVHYTGKSFDRWLSTRLESLGNTVVFTSAIAAVFLTRSGRLQAGRAGWGLTQALSITGLLTWAVRCLVDVETDMMSVLRVKELTGLAEDAAQIQHLAGSKTKDGVASLSQHPVWNVSQASLDSSALVKSGWPWHGRIKFTNVSMRYNPSAPLALTGIDLAVPAGTTLGVVGRTGSGKSSLLLTLFRITEIEADGSIEIDGVDIRSVSLSALRESLAIIPQDPTLFQGTIGFNLDATGRSTEAEMWTALEAASPALASQFRADRGLESLLSEGGKNLSAGQRQLVCLARALLRKSKILVLDEATSSVDSKTDQQVQNTIRREFVDKGVTVITIAHRLDTLKGYDRIAVLGAGKMLEYGPPQILLRNPKGEFRSLVDADLDKKRKGRDAVAATRIHT